MHFLGINWVGLTEQNGRKLLLSVGFCLAVAIVRALLRGACRFVLRGETRRAIQARFWTHQTINLSSARRGSNQGNTQNEKSPYHQSSIDFRCYLEVALFEPRPLLTLAKDLLPAARIVVPVVNTLERHVAGVCATILQTSNDL